MHEETLPSWIVSVAVPIILAVITWLSTWLVTAYKAKADLATKQKEFELAQEAQKAEFDGKKKAAALARDKQLYDTQQAIIDQLQENDEASTKRAASTDRKIDELYVRLGQERDYSTRWEEWHRDGMPDPPGRPKRQHLAEAPPGQNIN